MANRWLSAFAVALMCVLSSSTENGSSRLLNLSNGEYNITVLKRSELLKHGDPAQWTEINLSGNQIDEVDDNTFLGFDNLKKFSLASNMLVTIEDNWFKGSKLQSLDLSRNYLVSFRVDAFSGLTDLQELNLEKNLLMPFKPNVFDHTPHLKTLILKNNSRIQGIFHNVTIPSLEELDIQSCGITSIISMKLENLPNLKKLNLGGNTLSQLEGGAFTENTKLKEVDLRGNFLDELRGQDLKKAFSPGSKVVVYFDLHEDICINCNAHACDDDLELQTFVCQKPSEPSFRDTFEWLDSEKDIKITLKAQVGKTTV